MTLNGECPWCQGGKYCSHIIFQTPERSFKKLNQCTAAWSKEVYGESLVFIEI